MNSSRRFRMLLCALLLLVRASASSSAPPALSSHISSPTPSPTFQTDPNSTVMTIEIDTACTEAEVTLQNENTKETFSVYSQGLTTYKLLELTRNKTTIKYLAIVFEIPHIPRSGSFAYTVEKVVKRLLDAFSALYIRIDLGRRDCLLGTFSFSSMIMRDMITSGAPIVIFHMIPFLIFEAVFPHIPIMDNFILIFNACELISPAKEQQKAFMAFASLSSARIYTLEIFNCIGGDVLLAFLTMRTTATIHRLKLVSPGNNALEISLEARTWQLFMERPGMLQSLHVDLDFYMRLLTLPHEPNETAYLNHLYIKIERPLIGSEFLKFFDNSMFSKIMQSLVKHYSTYNLTLQNNLSLFYTKLLPNKNCFLTMLLALKELLKTNVHTIAELLSILSHISYLAAALSIPNIYGLIDHPFKLLVVQHVEIHGHNYLMQTHSTVQELFLQWMVLYIPLAQTGWGALYANPLTYVQTSTNSWLELIKTIEHPNYSAAWSQWVEPTQNSFSLPFSVHQLFPTIFSA